MKRFAFKLLVLLLLGAIINVAVAWACGLFVSTAGTYPTHKGLVSLNSEPHWSSRQMTLKGMLIIDAQAWGGTGMFRSRKLPPAWSATALNPSTDNVWSRLHIREIACGWPTLTLYSRSSETKHVVTKEGAVTLLGGIDLNALRRAAVLPLLPIWPGFAINTIFYAAIVWALFAVPGYIKRIRGGRRIKRGECVRCAYPLRTSPVCSECGTDSPSPPRGRAREGVNS